MISKMDNIDLNKINSELITETEWLNRNIIELKILDIKDLQFKERIGLLTKMEF